MVNKNMSIHILNPTHSITIKNVKNLPSMYIIVKQLSNASPTRNRHRAKDQQLLQNEVPTPAMKPNRFVPGREEESPFKVSVSLAGSDSDCQVTGSCICSEVNKYVYQKCGQKHQVKPSVQSLIFPKQRRIVIPSGFGNKGTESSAVFAHTLMRSNIFCVVGWFRLRLIVMASVGQEHILIIHTIYLYRG